MNRSTVYVCNMDDPDQEKLLLCRWCNRYGRIDGFLGFRCVICKFSDGGYRSFGTLWRSFGLKRREIAKIMGCRPQL